MVMFKLTLEDEMKRVVDELALVSHSRKSGEYLAKDELAFLKANVESGPLPKAFEPLPFDGLDGTYRFRQALVDEGLVETWTDVTPVHYTFKK